MTIHVSKILKSLKEIEEKAAEIRQLLFCPEGVRITAASRDDISFVEYWDGELSPRILFCKEEKIENKIIDHYIKEAIGLIPPSYCQNKTVEIHTDLMLDDFSEGTLIGIKIFNIELKYISEELMEHIRGRHDFNNHMSRVKELQGATD